MSHPPTIIIVHPSERRSKCTVEPLRGRGDFRFYTFTRHEPDDLSNYVRLGLGGPLLGDDDASKGLLVLDGTWRYTARMERAFGEVPVRSLPKWRTAYPRMSKLFEDPEQGLATIEAIYAAYLILGRDTCGLLDQYHWRDAFLAKNRARSDMTD